MELVGNSPALLSLLMDDLTTKGSTDLWCEDFTLYSETCCADTYTLLLIYAESFRRTNTVLLETFDILLLPDETSIYTEATHTNICMFSNGMTVIIYIIHNARRWQSDL